MDGDEVLSIAELAERGGVSRRTVRYYVQRGLLPAPAGRGRGDHYGAEHLRRLVSIRRWQEQGLSLDAVARLLSAEPGVEAAPPPPARPAARVWSRLELAPGVELSVAADAGLSGEVVQRMVAAARAALDERGPHDA